MQALGPFPIPVVGLPDEQQISGQGLATGVEITNLSGWLLRIQIGSRIEWLPAFRVDRFPLKEGDGNAVIVSAILLELLGSPENIYLMTVAYANDAPDYLSAFPGQYPHDVVRFLAPQNPPILLASATINGPGGIVMVSNGFEDIHVWGWEIETFVALAGGAIALIGLGTVDGVGVPPAAANIGVMRSDVKGQISGYHGGVSVGHSSIPFFLSSVTLQAFGAVSGQAQISYSVGPTVE